MNNCTGVSLDGAIVSTSSNGDLYTFTIAYTVNSCMILNGAKLQGGLTAGVIFDESTGTSPMASGVNTTGKVDKPNYVINWQLGDLTNGYNQAYYVTFSKQLKDAGVHTITGDWSVEGKDAEGNTVRVGFNELSYTVN
ncbi:hypothetical protein ABID22_003427 [Pontibacter aydingkolensis]|uniref:Uncharacterized protein n=1 Tax=Pontibacter aydingkolensis TaxID=1911536 RepID=A0ABS7CY65_9BACT|nr:hypothetical protein [Pontibacter aydingkolensis]MBW7468791.1 hypothetical protein [Pontibacter aydingkolensis]